MMEASEKMEYEEAAKYRDLIASVKTGCPETENYS